MEIFKNFLLACAVSMIAIFVVGMFIDFVLPFFMEGIEALR